MVTAASWVFFRGRQVAIWQPGPNFWLPNWNFGCQILKMYRKLGNVQKRSVTWRNWYSKLRYWVYLRIDSSYLSQDVLFGNLIFITVDFLGRTLVSARSPNNWCSGKNENSRDTQEQLPDKINHRKDMFAICKCCILTLRQIALFIPAVGTKS